MDFIQVLQSKAAEIVLDRALDYIKQKTKAMLSFFAWLVILIMTVTVCNSTIICGLAHHIHNTLSRVRPNTNSGIA